MAASFRFGEAQDKQIFPDVSVVEEGCEGKGGRCGERTGILQLLQGFLGLFSQHLSMGPVSLSQDPQHRLGFFNLPFHYQPPCGLQKQTRPAMGRVVEWIVKPFLWMKGREATTSEGPGSWW